MITVQSREDFLTTLRKCPDLPIKCVGVEIGVLYGEFSKQILDIIQPASLTLIDPFRSSDKTYDKTLSGLHTAYSTEDDYQKLIKKFYDEIISGLITVIRKFSYDAINDFQNNSLDFIYIDASHLYEDAKQDLNEWLPKLKPNGIMCGHDYMEFDSFGVMQAVNEFMEQYKFEMIIFNENGGDWALQKINE